MESGAGGGLWGERTVGGSSTDFEGATPVGLAGKAPAWGAGRWGGGATDRSFLFGSFVIRAGAFTLGEATTAGAKSGAISWTTWGIAPGMALGSRRGFGLEITFLMTTFPALPGSDAFTGAFADGAFKGVGKVFGNGGEGFVVTVRTGMGVASAGFPAGPFIVFFVGIGFEPSSAP